MSTFDELLEIAFTVPLRPPYSHQSHSIFTLTQQLDHLLAEELTYHFVIISARDRKLHDLPGVLVAERATDTVEPCVE